MHPGAIRLFAYNGGNMKQQSKPTTSLFGFFLASVLFSAASNSAHPVTPTLFMELGFPDYMFGVALAANLGMNFLFSPFWGKLNLYVSSRHLLAIGSFGYAFAQLLFGLASTQAEIIIARLVCGFFIGALFVGQLTYLVHQSADDYIRGRNLTVLATVNAVASAFGYMTGGLIGDFSVHGAIWTQVALLVITGILYLISCCDDNELTLRDANRKALIRDSNPFASFLAAKSFLTPLFFAMFLMTMLQNLAYTGFDQSFNYYTKDQFGFSSGYTGLIKGGIGLITLLANTTLCTRLMKKTDIRRSCIPVLLISTLAMIGIAGLRSIIPFVLITVVYYAASAVCVPLLQNIVATHGSGEKAGLVMGFYNSLKYLGGFFGALGSGLLYDIHPQLPFLMAAAVLAVSTILSVICYRKDWILHPYRM